MTLDVRFHPLRPGDFPRAFTPADDRRWQPFKQGFSNTLKIIERELRHLQARDIVISIDCPAAHIRVDGWPRADCKVNSPAVVLSATTKHGPMRWACDCCRNYEDNIRAIALTLERLRQCDLYGVTGTGEQYTGWKALPAGEIDPDTMTPDQAAAAILDLAGLRMKSGTALDLFTKKQDEYDRVRRLAAKKHHPDAGGKPEDWARFDRACQIVDGAMAVKGGPI